MKAYYSFYHHHDLWKLRHIAEPPGVTIHTPGDLYETEIWDRSLLDGGDQAIHALIEEALLDTLVTVVFIGDQIHDNPYVDYEISQSIARQNGLVGIQIHNISNQDGRTDSPGQVPQVFKDGPFKAYRYFDKYKLADWIKEAANLARDHYGETSTDPLQDSWIRDGNETSNPDLFIDPAEET